MNVLLTCTGRRNYLVHYFRQALAGRGKVPALQDADAAFLLPRVDDPGFCEALLDTCRKWEVRLLISLNDLELPVLAGQRARFTEAGVLPVVSSPRVVDICLDKWKTSWFLSNLGIAAPRTYVSLGDAQRAITAGDLRFPVVLKPRWGTGSIGLEMPEDLDELGIAYHLLRRRLGRTILGALSASDPKHCVLIQERLVGQEHGMDVVNDLHGRHVATFARRKLEMRAGETDRAVTVHDEALSHLGRILGEALGHVGGLDCDVFLTEAGPRVLEMNPRFGGGYPFSHAAGANIPAALIAWATGAKPEARWLAPEAGVCSSKCDRLVTAAPNAEPPQPLRAKGGKP